MSGAWDHLPPAPAVAYERPEECPDAGHHARTQRSGDYAKPRRYQCPTCGFWCLLAPAEEGPA